MNAARRSDDGSATKRGGDGAGGPAKRVKTAVAHKAAKDAEVGLNTRHAD